MDVYIVRGETGEYSDWQCWDVAAYTSKEDAEYHAAQAQKAAEELSHWICPDCGFKYAYHLWPCAYEECLRPPNPHDLDCRIDYTGTGYHVVTIPLYSGRVPEEGWKDEEQE